MSNACLLFVERSFPNNKEMHLQALHLNMATSLVDEATKQIAQKILSIIEELSSESISSLSNYNIYMKAKTYFRLGSIALNGGTKESAREAVKHYEKAQAIYNTPGVLRSSAIAADYTKATISTQIAKAKAIYEATESNIEEETRQCKEVYENYVKLFGQEAIHTIRAGASLAFAMKKAFHGIESERLLVKLVAISKRAHGPDHSTTKLVESYLKLFKVRIVNAKYKGKTSIFQALRFEEGKIPIRCKWYQAFRNKEDGKKKDAYTIMGPIAKPGDFCEKTLLVPPDSALLVGGTPVIFICRGQEELAHLNGKIGDIHSREAANGSLYYDVHFEEADTAPCRVEAKFLRILFELPEAESR